MSEFLLSVACEYKILKNGFVITDGASNTKRQINITSAEEEILIYIMYDSSICETNGNESVELTEIMDDETLVLLNCITDISEINDDTFTDSLFVHASSSNINEIHEIPGGDTGFLFSNSQIIHF